MPGTARVPVVPADAGPPTDAQLVVRARDGDPLAFETIMRRHNRLLFRSARSIVADDAQAQDAVQDAWLRAFTHLSTFRGEASLSTWLASIAIHAALDSARRNGRLVPMDDPPQALFDATRENPMTTLPPDSEAPDAAAARGEVRVLLESVIAQLPPIYRSVFMLRAVQEMSVEETARCLHVDPTVVRTRYLRARAMLRDMLGNVLEAQAASTFPFAGQRCESVVRHVMTELQRQGLLHSG